MATFTVLFGCLAFFVVIGIVLAIFSSIFGWRRRRWGYPGYYYDRPRPFFPWLFMGEWFPRRGFYDRRGEFEHHEHMHGPDRAGGAFGGRGPDRAGGAFGGGRPGGHGGFGGGGHMGGGGHGG